VQLVEQQAIRRVPRHAFNRLGLDVFGCAVHIAGSSLALALLERNFDLLQRTGRARADLYYRVSFDDRARRFFIIRAGQPPLAAADDGEFLYLFEKDLTVELQRFRRDLYFVHAAALEFAGKAILLVAPSGQGKSTTAWGLLQHGFGYMTDELAAVDLRRMAVAGYSHALCLKQRPPGGYPLPTKTLRTARTLHVPASLLRKPAARAPLPLGAILFVAYGGMVAPRMKPLGKAEAAAHLFVQALNPLAHAEDGLEGADRIVCNAACFKLRSGDLKATCELVKKTLESVASAGLRYASA